MFYGQNQQNISWIVIWKNRLCMIMYGQMKRYKESLKNTPDPIMPSQLPQMNLDLRGLMNYAKSIGKKVVDLTDAEKR